MQWKNPDIRFEKGGNTLLAPNGITEKEVEEDYARAMPYGGKKRSEYFQKLHEALLYFEKTKGSKFYVERELDSKLADGGYIENNESALRLLDKLKEEGKLKRYIDTRGTGKKVFETIIPNTRDKNYYMRYESMERYNLGILQNMFLDENDLINWFKITKPILK
jgi:hypothetical protein